MMTTNTWMAGALVCLQGASALGVLVGGITLLLTGVDRHSRMRKRWPLIGLCLWALWMLWLAATGRHDSPPAVAMTLLVAAVLLAYGRQVRGILDGEAWWPPNAHGAGGEVTVYMKPVKPVEAGEASAKDTGWLARFARFVEGVTSVAGHERVHRGRWSPHTYRPGGGLLLAYTDVQVHGRWLVLPFLSYLSPYVCTHVGWAPSGALGIAFTVSWSGSISVEG